MNNDDIIYLAGIVDGEGSIMLIRESESSNTVWPQAMLTVASKDHELVVWLKDTFGGRICNKIDKRYNTVNFEWRISNRQAATLVEKIFPHLKIYRKIRRACILIDYYETMKQGGWYAPNEYAERQELIIEFFAA